jgi:hypothetical protein
MAETNGRKKVLSLDVFEVPTRNGGRDHEVEVSGSWNGVDVSFKTTIDKVRDFFTKPREEAPAEEVAQ